MKQGDLFQDWQGLQFLHENKLKLKNKLKSEIVKKIGLKMKNFSIMGVH